MEKVKKNVTFHNFVSKVGNWKLLELYAKATKQFREHHNNYYKPNFTQEEYVKWNDLIREDWYYKPLISQVSKNRQFDTYRFPSLEASCKNPDKKRYSRLQLQKDLSVFFPYLPFQEIQRMTYVFTWLMKEALKNYGHLCIPEFGTFCLFDRPLRETHRAFCSQKWVQPRYRLNRSIMFYPSTILYNIVTPRNVMYMGFEGKFNRSQYIPEMFGSYIDEKIHRYRGRLFITDVFSKHWEWLGYDDDLLRELRNLHMWDIIDSESYDEENATEQDGIVVIEGNERSNRKNKQS